MGGTSINNWSPTVVKYCEMLVEKYLIRVRSGRYCRGEEATDRDKTKVFTSSANDQ